MGMMIKTPDTEAFESMDGYSLTTQWHSVTGFAAANGTSYPFILIQTVVPQTISIFVSTYEIVVFKRKLQIAFRIYAVRSNT